MPTATTPPSAVLRGGEWLIKESNAFDIYIPEDFTEEERMILDMCHQFLLAEVLPVADRIERLEPGLMPSLLEKAGEQGLLAAAFPEQYGGLGKNFITATAINEGLGNKTNCHA